MVSRPFPSYITILCVVDPRLDLPFISICPIHAEQPLVMSIEHLYYIEKPEIRAPLLDVQNHFLLIELSTASTRFPFGKSSVYRTMKPFHLSHSWSLLRAVDVDQETSIHTLNHTFYLFAA